MAAVGKRVITLMSSDGVVFKVEAAKAMESQTIKCLIEGDYADNSSIPIPIPIPNVTGSILSKVIEYCRKHAEAAANAGAGGVSAEAEGADEALKAWDADFINVGQHVLYHLIMAADYLNIKGLLDLACQTVADIIKGKTPDQIRAYFNIRNDFTPEEQEEIRRENQGIFD